MQGRLPKLGLLNLKYNAIPADFVTGIVSEFGLLPATSVPVILREYAAAKQEAQ
jgi:translation initiation factor eIF-2B subunit delta